MSEKTHGPEFTPGPRNPDVTKLEAELAAAQAEIATLAEHLRAAKDQWTQAWSKLAAERERSAGLAAVITREHGPQYVTEFDCAAILTRVRAEAKREGAVEALKAMNTWEPELYGPEPVWLILQEMSKEIRRRIAALEGGA